MANQSCPDLVQCYLIPHVSDVNECDSSPCMYGATCTDIINGYTCSCAHGYTGVHCETGESFWFSVFTFRCNITDHELLIQIRDSCVVRNEPFLYRLKTGQIPQSVKLHLTDTLLSRRLPIGSLALKLKDRFSFLGSS